MGKSKVKAKSKPWTVQRRRNVAEMHRVYEASQRRTRFLAFQELVAQSQEIENAETQPPAEEAP